VGDGHFGDIVRAAWWIVATSVAVFVAAAFGIALLVTSVYESRAQLFVSMPNQAVGNDVYESNLFSQQLLPAYAELVKGDLLTSRVVDELALGLSPAELAQKVSMSYAVESVVFDIVATDDSPERARDIANTMAVELSAVVADLEAPEGGEAPAVALRMRSEAEASDAPISPNIVIYLLCGAGAGLLVGIALVLIRHCVRPVGQ
jgi:capsular polysaccharide biosynthesis protein